MLCGMCLHVSVCGVVWYVSACVCVWCCVVCVCMCLCVVLYGMCLCVMLCGMCLHVSVCGVVQYVSVSVCGVVRYVSACVCVWCCAVCVCVCVWCWLMQTIETSRGAVLALGFMIGRLLHHGNDNLTTAAAADNVSVNKMDVDDSSRAVSTESSLNSVISSAVSELGHYVICFSFHLLYIPAYKWTNFGQFFALKVWGSTYMQV